MKNNFKITELIDEERKDIVLCCYCYCFSFKNLMAIGNNKVKFYICKDCLNNIKEVLNNTIL